MDPTTIQIEVDGPVAVATIARPDKLNALSRATVADLTAAVDQFRANSQVRVLILMGAGRMFSAGADIEEFRDDFAAGTVNAAVTEYDARAGARLTDALAAPELVTIAAVHGAAIGGAAAIVAACDLCILAEGARIIVPELAMGLPLSWGAVPRLVDLLGPMVARDLLLTGRPMECEEAFARGVASRIVPSESLLSSAREIANLIARCPAFGTTAVLHRVNALTAGRQVDDEAATLAQAVADPAVIASTRAYLDSLGAKV